MARPLPAGNAVRLWFTPPAGAVTWRVLRRPTAQVPISGPTDAGAVMVRDSADDLSILDIDGLTNGTQYTYAVFYLDQAGAWMASGADSTATATPAASYGSDSTDPQALMRERLDLGLAVEIARGALLPETGKIPVLTAPFAMQENLSLPAVSVHLDSDEQDQQAIGEVVFPSDHHGNSWTQYEGRLSRITLGIVGVSLNGDERVALRQALQRVIMANFPVFDEAGLVQITMNLRDEEREGPDNAVLYYTRLTFTCLAPSFVAEEVPAIAGVSVTLNPLEPTR